MTTTAHHVLYRFFDADGALLYVGITMNAPARFGQHRDDKPWWADVARIDMEHFDSREEVLEAEAEAIIAEHPAHNVVHNTARSTLPRRPRPPKGPLDAGQPVALCMEDGNCHVGMIDANDGNFLTITHKDWLSGFYWSNQRTIRISDIVQAHHAGLHDGVWHDDHFGRIQTEWINAHRPAASA